MPSAEYSESRILARQRMFRRDQRLLQLGYKSYEDYIHSPAWMDVKQRYWASNFPQDCAGCGGSMDLMHHKTYERVGEEWISDLMPLCWTCHGQLHDLERDGIISLDFSGVIDRDRAVAGRELLADQAASRTAELKRHKAEERAATEAIIATLSLADRIRRAKSAAARPEDIKGALFTLRGAMWKGKLPHILRRLEHLEATAYGWYERVEGMTPGRLETQERRRKIFDGNLPPKA